MRSALRTALPALAIVAALAFPAEAQQASSTVVADLRADVEEVEKKILDLARAIPEDKYSWRPAAGVRSISEVLVHIAADNYLIPAMIGFPADPATGIKGDDYNTALAFEKRTMSKAAAIAEVEKSFAFVKKSMTDTPPARLEQAVTVFGSKSTPQKVWILGTTHLHEHLGQLIAYARSNGVKPPWS
jgi:uncharacterized damage-inducible protein DinB